MAPGQRDLPERDEAEILDVRIARVDTPREARQRRVGRRSALGLISAAVAGLVILGWMRAEPASRVPLAARAPGAVGVAGAYGFPRRCLSITIAPGHPGYARADFDRRQACGRYTGDPTAVFHRRGGAWRMVLDAVAYSCPVASLPTPVQLTLGVCDTTAAPVAQP